MDTVACIRCRWERNSFPAKLPSDPARREREKTYRGPKGVPGSGGNRGIAYVPRGIGRQSDRSTTHPVDGKEGSQGTCLLEPGCCGCSIRPEDSKATDAVCWGYLESRMRRNGARPVRGGGVGVLGLPSPGPLPHPIPPACWCWTETRTRPGTSSSGLLPGWGHTSGLTGCGVLRAISAA
jgi:hypothetical protein